jgi:hypothetical protein
MKKRLFFAFYALLLTMCRFYEQAEPFRSIDGLSCRAYTAYLEEGVNTSRGVECSYTCPNGEIVGPLDFESDPSLSATKGDMDRLYCGIVPPTFTSAPTLIANSPTPAETPTLSASPTVFASPTSGSPLLTEQVTMCDTGSSLISFRIATPVPDLTGRTLTVVIADQESICAVNPTNPSLLTCTLPLSITFPTQVVVSLDGAVVNDFAYNGLGCDQITTPAATTTP